MTGATRRASLRRGYLHRQDRKDLENKDVWAGRGHSKDRSGEGGPSSMAGAVGSRRQAQARLGGALSGVRVRVRGLPEHTKEP